MSQDDVFIFVFDVRFVYLLCIICTVIVLSSNLYLLIAFNKLWLLHSFYLLIPEYEQRVARGGGCSEHPEVSFAARHNSIKAHFFAVKRTLFYSKKMTLNDNHWRTLNDVRLSKKSAWDKDFFIDKHFGRVWHLLASLWNDLTDFQAQVRFPKAHLSCVLFKEWH